jgi:hypothetical protein
MTDLDDKIRAAAKATAKKVNESYRDLKEEYKREKNGASVQSESEIRTDLEGAADKVEAGVKAVADKIDDAYRNMKSEYRKEKVKAKLH